MRPQSNVSTPSIEQATMANLICQHLLWQKLHGVTLPAECEGAFVCFRLVVLSVWGDAGLAHDGSGMT
eukprot:995091-Prymnesium_polylepis.1